MIAALLLGFALFALSLYFHLWMLRWAKAISPAGKDPRHLRLLGGASIVLLSHLVIAAIFAAGMYLAAQWGLGSLEKDVIDSWMDYYYFALITVSTVGLGDILPAGHMRAISGIAALTGFLMISCTAQYVYKTMSKEES
ncbi:two pore domain potassium channel family protein [Altererythrobacter aurantiacus]|uniref:Two pore domain potassium channel family protein n=1 Tax=Parapontixanthobacter aurantiacus TaxID=1463599 RepID=A0A844ZC17_9SPHN|nr:potassium channel family protein [Parapontixanthobacter aurantiacus]MXO85074.1 two pore domain potassium channel family protein [Parapontixanthobacter aurantiacus]